MAESIKVRKIGKYILKEKLGEGSMGSVWLSHHSGLNLPVAIKLLDMKLAEEDPDFLNRFMQEGRLAGQLNHKNIVRIYDAGIEGGNPFIAMEYIEGCDTLELLETRGALPPDEVLGLAIATSEALQEAHSLGIIHRDIKPDNILATTEGRIKLADLGLAKQIDDNLGGTMAGTALGTPYYISPEQALDAIKADARSDIYSLGATLYHLLTGVVPYEGDNPMGVMLRHTNEPLIPPQERLKGLPLSFCKVICKMMEKDPGHRYQNCQELHEDLIKLKYGHDDVAETSEKALRGQLASGKSIRVRMKISPSEKYANHGGKSQSIKKRSGSRNKTKKKESSKKGLLIVLVLFFAMSLTLIPSLMKKKATKYEPTATVDQEEISIQNQDTTPEKVTKEEEPPEIIPSSKTLNLLSNNGKDFFEENYPEFFTFKDGLMYVDDLGKRPQHNGQIYLKETYDNFRLTIEYRFLKKRSDSGIHFYANKRDRFFEVQLGRNSHLFGGHFLGRKCHYKKNETTKYAFQQKVAVEKEIGEWNTTVIEANKGNLKTTINGQILYNISDLSHTEGYLSVTCWNLCQMEIRKLILEELD